MLLFFGNRVSNPQPSLRVFREGEIIHHTASPLLARPAVYPVGPMPWLCDEKKGGAGAAASSVCGMESKGSVLRVHDQHNGVSLTIADISH
jgi:hypothetical protein